MTITLQDALARWPGAEVYRPGDGPDLNAEIIALMRRGAKTASCAALCEFEGGEAMPEVGRVDIATDWQARPQLATRTIALERMKYREMDAARVPPQGEFDDLEAWRRGYAAYLDRITDFTPDTELLFERFEVVEDFGSDQHV
ncbi:ASCH domain-containing protein [Cribrihabitans sp. XS_ASV171]